MVVVCVCDGLVAGASGIKELFNELNAKQRKAPKIWGLKYRFYARMVGYTKPWSIMLSATLTNPAMLAPRT